MEKYNLSEFKALREAGLDSDEMLTRVHDFYVERCFDAVRTASRDVWHKQGAIRGLCTTVGLWLIGLTIFGALICWGTMGVIGYNHYAHSCEDGNTANCLSLVQENISGLDALTEARRYTNEIAHLRVQYKIRTGRDLPDVK